MASNIFREKVSAGVETPNSSSSLESDVAKAANEALNYLRAAAVGQGSEKGPWKVGSDMICIYIYIYNPGTSYGISICKN